MAGVDVASVAVGLADATGDEADGLEGEGVAEGVPFLRGIALDGVGGVCQERCRMI